MTLAADMLVGFVKACLGFFKHVRVRGSPGLVAVLVAVEWRSRAWGTDAPRTYINRRVAY